MIGIRSLKEKKRKAREVTEKWMDTPITLPPISMEDVSDKPLIVEAEVAGYLVRRIYIDRGASVEVMFEHCFENLSLAIKAKLKETQTDLVGFAREATKPLGKIELEVCFGSEGTGLRALRATPSTIHSMMKFPTPRGITTLATSSMIISKCRRLEKKQVVEEEKAKAVETKAVNVTKETLVNPAFPEQLVVIGGGLPETCKAQLKLLLKDNMDIFAWEPTDMTGVPRRIIEHKLNVNTSIKPTRQKHRVLAPEKSEVKARDVGEWVKDGINLNSACLKDFYPLLNIDCKVESVIGFKYKCFLDAYKGYHQIQMLREDEEKTAFYTNQGTYCYTKMPFGLEKADATYQLLIDSTFKSQIKRNLEAYVDDMVIKMEEGKFLGYMVTSKGIVVNPKKTKILADLQSPRTLKEMQSLVRKLAALNSIVTSKHDEEVKAVFRSTPSEDHHRLAHKTDP
ncbi:reverse transcriptase domain-containing protein [Tanacetum coccineum]